MLQAISPNVYMWTEIHGAERDEPYVWNSYAIRVPAEDKLVLVDPLAISEDDEDQLQSIAVPTHVLLSCEYHLRESERYRKRYGCKLLANKVELERYETPISDGPKGILRRFLDSEAAWLKLERLWQERGPMLSF